MSQSQILRTEPAEAGRGVSIGVGGQRLDAHGIEGVVQQHAIPVVVALDQHVKVAAPGATRPIIEVTRSDTGGGGGSVASNTTAGTVVAPPRSSFMAMAPKARRNQYVIKRDGREEDVHFDKITVRIERLVDEPYKLSDFVDPSIVAQKVIPQLFSGITTGELDDLSAQQAASMTSLHPDFAVLAARITASNLHKNTSDSFVETAVRLFEYIEPKTGKKAPMIGNAEMAFILKHGKELDAAIVYERDGGYDYFGFKTLQHSYLLKIDGKIVERPQHMLMRVSCGIHWSVPCFAVAFCFLLCSF